MNRDFYQINLSKEHKKGSMNNPFYKHEAAIIPVLQDPDCAVLSVGGVDFCFDQRYVLDTLGELWLESESILHSIDDVYLELWPCDYRALNNQMNRMGA